MRESATRARRGLLHAVAATILGSCSPAAADVIGCRTSSWKHVHPTREKSIPRAEASQHRPPPTRTHTHTMPSPRTNMLVPRARKVSRCRVVGSEPLTQSKVLARVSFPFWCRRFSAAVCFVVVLTVRRSAADALFLGVRRHGTDTVGQKRAQRFFTQTVLLLQNPPPCPSEVSRASLASQTAWQPGVYGSEGSSRDSSLRIRLVFACAFSVSIA